MFSKLPLLRIAETGPVQVFLYVQLLDFLTTLIGFKLGAVEGSPFVRLLMHLGPVAGVAASKLVALVLAGFCLYLKKPHLIRRATYWYCCLIIWNLMVILGSPKMLD